MSGIKNVFSDVVIAFHRHSEYHHHNSQYAIINPTTHHTHTQMAPPRLLPNIKSVPKPQWRPPKPHLAKFHLESQTPPILPSFVPPSSPALPPPRRPAFSPGGFGLQSAPQATESKGKEKALEEVDRKDGESEACYVVSPSL